jgi:hypothetical protein
MQHAAGFHIVLKIRIRCVQRSGNDAALLALAAFAQVDEEPRRSG